MRTHEERQEMNRERADARDASDHSRWVALALTQAALLDAIRAELEKPEVSHYEGTWLVAMAKAYATITEAQ